MQQYNTASNQGNSSQALATLSFNGNDLNPVERDGQIWMTASDLAKALSYKNSKSVTNLFNANSSEFTSGMTRVIDSVTNGINGSKRKMAVRIFSLRGCHMIAMFARTDIAKSFRKWVLDILDREVGAPVIEQPPAIADADWVRYSRSMTIPEMAQFTNHSEQQVINALHKVMGGSPCTSRPARVMTTELQYALDQFWGFVSNLNIKEIDHSLHSNELAISIPEIYGLAKEGELPDTRIIYQALRLSSTPRFHRANAVIQSRQLKKTCRVWIFIQSFNQPSIAIAKGL